MDEIKKAEQAIKQLKDFIELRKAAGKMALTEHKDELNKMAHDAMCVVHSIAASIAYEE